MTFNSSYFWTCWNVRPNASASFSWLIPEHHPAHAQSAANMLVPAYRHKRSEVLEKKRGLFITRGIGDGSGSRPSGGEAGGDRVDCHRGNGDGAPRQSHRSVNERGEAGLRRRR